MKTPDPAPLQAALAQLHQQRAEIAALRSKEAELRAQLGDADPLDDAAVARASLAQTQLGLIPARLAKVEAGTEALAQQVARAIEVFHRELRDVARAEREEKAGRIAVILKPYFADQTGEGSNLISPAREIAERADQLQTIPFDRVGTLAVTDQPRSNQPARFDRELEERAAELLAIFAAWNQAGRQFGGAVK